MKVGLFINTRQAKCSIHESGRMLYQSLLSFNWRLDYVEINQLNYDDLYAGKINCYPLEQQYDFYIFNHHPITMKNVENLDASRLKNLPGKKISIVLEMLKNELLPNFYYMNFEDFDDYIVLDPTFQTNLSNVHPFPRPILNCRPIKKLTTIPDVPIIGSFGFPGEDKNFPMIMDKASKEFEYSIVRLNIPAASYIGTDECFIFAEECRKLKPENVDLIITHDFLGEEQLLTWCQRNHLNVFFYSRNVPGLAAATDQIIMAGAPLLVSNNEAFRHLHPYIKPFSEWSFKDAMLKSQDQIELIRQDWSKDKIIEKFKKII